MILLFSLAILATLGGVGFAGMIYFANAMSDTGATVVPGWPAFAGMVPAVILWGLVIWALEVG